MEIILEELFRILNWRMEIPGLYGWFHLMSFALSFLALAWLCRTHRPGPDRVRKVVFRTSLLVLALEIYKQIVYNLSYTAETGWQVHMQWYSFPWQFCSMPMYVGLLAGIIKKGRVHDALCAFLATYSVFAGLCVMLYPADVFIDLVGVNVQTMVCHGSMLTIGGYLFYTGHVKLKHQTVLKAMPVFAVCIAIAMLLNETAYRTGLLAAGHTFNMFFISPYCAPSLPVYSAVQACIPYPYCLIIYILVFTLAAYLILLLAMGADRLAGRRKNRPSLPA